MNIYNHHAVKSIEFMVCDMLIILDKWENISEKVDNDLFWTLDDNIVDHALYVYRKNIIDNIQYQQDMSKVNVLWNRLKERDLYKTEYNMSLENIRGNYVNHYLNITKGDDQIYKVPLYINENNYFYLEKDRKLDTILTIIKE